jgi:hypothetical protein
MIAWARAGLVTTPGAHEVKAAVVILLARSARALGQRAVPGTGGVPQPPPTTR